MLEIELVINFSNKYILFYVIDMVCLCIIIINNEVRKKVGEEINNDKISRNDTMILMILCSTNLWRILYGMLIF